MAENEHHIKTFRTSYLPNNESWLIQYHDHVIRKMPFRVPPKTFDFVSEFHELWSDSGDERWTIHKCRNGEAVFGAGSHRFPVRAFSSRGASASANELLVPDSVANSADR